MPKFDKHIFICGNQRPAGSPRPSCDPSGAGDLHRAFKTCLAKASATILVRANKSGCLEQCEHGPTVVVYPDAVWYGHVTLADVEEIVQSHILGGRTVARLQLAEACLNTTTCEHRSRSGS